MKKVKKKSEVQNFTQSKLRITKEKERERERETKRIRLVTVKYKICGFD